MKTTLYFGGKTSTGLLCFRSDKIFGHQHSVYFTTTASDDERVVLKSVSGVGITSSCAFGEGHFTVTIKAADVALLTAGRHCAIDVDLSFAN